MAPKQTVISATILVKPIQVKRCTRNCDEPSRIVADTYLNLLNPAREGH
jgi:hypothetical protein